MTPEAERLLRRHLHKKTPISPKKTPEEDGVHRIRCSEVNFERGSLWNLIREGYVEFRSPKYKKDCYDLTKKGQAWGRNEGIRR